MTEIEFFGTVGTEQTFYEPDNLVFRNYAPEMIRRFAEQSTVINDADAVVNKLLTHGCWCAKLDKQNPYLEFLGGPDTVDELDEICKNWFKCRNCNDRLRYGSCNVDYSSSMENLKSKSYRITASDYQEAFLETVSCVTSLDECADDTCTIDMWYLKDIYQYLEDNHQVMSSLHVVDNSTCSTPVNTNKTRICTGTAPSLMLLVRATLRCTRSGATALDPRPVRVGRGGARARTGVWTACTGSRRRTRTEPDALAVHRLIVMRGVGDEGVRRVTLRADVTYCCTNIVQDI